MVLLVQRLETLVLGSKSTEDEERVRSDRQNKETAGRAPLGGRVHDEDDLALELLKVVDLVAGAGRLEAVEGRVGHSGGGREKRAATRGRKEREGLRCGTVYVRVGEEGAVTLTACDGDAVDEGFISRAGEI